MILCRRIVFTGLALLWMGLIFWFSAQPSEESANMSHRVGRMAGELFVPGFSHWPEQKQEDFAAAIDYPLRKCAHASEYAVLAVLLFLMFASYQPSVKRGLALAFFTAAVYAASDEFHQLFVPGRSGQARDVIIDSIGALVGCGVSFLIARIGKRIWSKR